MRAGSNDSGALSWIKPKPANFVAGNTYCQSAALSSFPDFNRPVAESCDLRGIGGSNLVKDTVKDHAFRVVRHVLVCAIDPAFKQGGVAEGFGFKNDILFVRAAGEIEVDSGIVKASQ